jgi:hypothetical protein
VSEESVELTESLQDKARDLSSGSEMVASSASEALSRRTP